MKMMEEIDDDDDDDGRNRVNEMFCEFIYL